MSDTPAVRNVFVIFPEGQQPEGYIINILLNIAGVYLKIYSDWTWHIYMRHIAYKPAVTIAT